MTIVNVEERDKYLTFLQNEVSRLKDETFLLKRALRQVIALGLRVKVPLQISLETEELETASWVEKDKQFAGLRSQVLECTLRLIGFHNRPVTQEEILRSFNNDRRYHVVSQNVRNPETITRRLRELADEKLEWLSRPKEGTYFYGTRIIREVQTFASATEIKPREP